MSALTTPAAYQPSARICGLRERVLHPGDNAPRLDPWRYHYHYLEGWMAAADYPLSTRQATALAHVIEKLPVHVRHDDILAGEHVMSACPMALSIGGVPTAEQAREQVAASTLSPAEQEQLLAWLGTDPFGHHRMAALPPWPVEVHQALRRGVIDAWGTSTNHSVRAYEKVLRLGFAGLLAEVEAALAELSLGSPDAPTRRAHLLGWQRLCRAAMTLGERHAAAIREQAELCEDPLLRDDMEELAQVCERVPAQPARTFREAVQALWFAHMITAWEDMVNANSIGRVDQFLWPYLQRELDEGTITADEAREILAALWIKLYLPYDVQQMTIGGQRPDGSDAVNPLSYLVLDVTEALGFVRCLSARLHRGTPREFISRCVDLVARGGGIPFFFSDETMIPALVGKGIAIEDARDYAAIGCVEITIPGKANPHAVSNWINTAKCLELALNDGRCLTDGVFRPGTLMSFPHGEPYDLDDLQIGPHTGTLADFASMADVLKAYTTQFEHFAELACFGSSAIELALPYWFLLPYQSLLTDDCVARGLDILEGGARYNYHGSAAVGIPNVADSLAALDTAVFTDATVTPGEMLAALRSDFAGQEPLRLYLRNTLPKYGNDAPLPDRYAADVTRLYCEVINRFASPAGGSFFATLFTFVSMIGYGKVTGAAPDGRHAGEPLAYSASPSQGRDREGLTAALASLSRLPSHMVPASTSAILEADPTLLEGEGREAFVDLIVTAIDQGVSQMQFNVVSADTLRAAQSDPERYRSLCVRVSGFSQQFGLLDREMQDHIIARTKHTR